MNAMAYQAVAVATAAGAGALLGGFFQQRWDAVQRKRRMRRGALSFRDGSGDMPDQTGRSLAVSQLIGLSRRLVGRTGGRLAPTMGFRWIDRWFSQRCACAGLKGVVSAAAFREACFRWGVFCAAAGMVAGSVVSNEMGVLLLLVGATFGFSAPFRSVADCVRFRARQMESCLSEMLEVVALGLRSGLSFDRSFELYGSHFETGFAESCRKAHRSWSSGLVTREEALGNLADSYDSVQLRRVCDNAVRSLRFGSALSESLEAAAREARSVHRSNVEERVAKAPVKMMVPTGALILPAMLLMVLGPVLLELVEGF